MDDEKRARRAHSNRTKPGSDEKQELRLRYSYSDRRARRDHAERVFGLCVLAIVIACGLTFMAIGIQGGRELVIGGISYFAGHTAKPKP